MSANAPSERSAVEERSLATELLRVDYESERLRVGEGQIGGAWQIPLELARRASRTGASTISIRFDGARLFVRDDGRGVGRGVLSALAELLDPVTHPEARHRALVMLEQAHELGFLALASAGVRRVWIRASSEGSKAELAWRHGERPRVKEYMAVHEQTTIEVEASWDRAAVRAALHERCRFALATIVVDGRTVLKGFPDAFVTTNLGSPLEGVLALAPRSSARAFLLLDGVIAAHATLPEGPSCEAAIEMRPWIGARCAPAALREAFHEHQATLLKHARELILDRARSMQALSESERRFIRRELLTLARQRVVPRKALTVPILPALAQGGERWLSLLDLGHESRVIDAIFPDQDRGRFILSSAPVLVLDADERALLGELLDIGFRAPPERPRDARTWIRCVHKALRVFRDRASAFWRARVVSEAALAPRERDTLHRLREQLPGHTWDVRLCAGRGRARRSGNTLLVPRGNPFWRAGRSVAEKDPTWFYPLIVALFEGRAMPAESTKHVWRGRGVRRKAGDPVERS